MVPSRMPFAICCGRVESSTPATRSKGRSIKELLQIVRRVVDRELLEVGGAALDDLNDDRPLGRIAVEPLERDVARNSRECLRVVERLNEFLRIGLVGALERVERQGHGVVSE